MSSSADWPMRIYLFDQSEFDLTVGFLFISFLPLLIWRAPIIDLQFLIPIIIILIQKQKTIRFADDSLRICLPFLITIPILIPISTTLLPLFCLLITEADIYTRPPRTTTVAFFGGWCRSYHFVVVIVVVVATIVVVGRKDRKRRRWKYKHLCCHRTYLLYLYSLVGWTMRRGKGSSQLFVVVVAFQTHPAADNVRTVPSIRKTGPMQATHTHTHTQRTHHQWRLLLFLCRHWRQCLILWRVMSEWVIHRNVWKAIWFQKCCDDPREMYILYYS